MSPFEIECVRESSFQISAIKFISPRKTRGADLIWCWCRASITCFLTGVHFFFMRIKESKLKKTLRTKAATSQRASWRCLSNPPIHDTISVQSEVQGVESVVAMEFNPRFNAAHYIDLIEGETASAPAASAGNVPARPQSSGGRIVDV